MRIISHGMVYDLVFFIPSCFCSERNNYTWFILFWNLFFILTILTIYYNVLPHLYDFFYNMKYKKPFSIQLRPALIPT
jgi:hypothetical protein